MIYYDTYSNYVSHPSSIHISAYYIELKYPIDFLNTCGDMQLCFDKYVLILLRFVFTHNVQYFHSSIQQYISNARKKQTSS